MLADITLSSWSLPTALILSFAIAVFDDAVQHPASCMKANCWLRGMVFHKTDKMAQPDGGILANCLYKQAKNDATSDSLTFTVFATGWHRAS